MGEMFRRKEGRKVFFFEKKKQKTFIHWLGAGCEPRGQGIKVFCFFFSKKKAFLSFLNAVASGRYVMGFAPLTHFGLRAPDACDDVLDFDVGHA